MNKKIKIGSVILLSTLIVVVFAISLITNSESNYKIKYIVLNGNYHLSQNEYLKYAHLESQETFDKLTARIVKDRFEKHPYIKNVKVILNESTLHINIVEKKFDALLMMDKNEFLISDASVIVPKLPNSEKIDYPIISEPFKGESIKEFSRANSNKDLIIGLKIITTLKIVNPKLYENLSEVNLRDGKDIILQFSNINVPIVVGRDNEVEKIILLDKLLEKIDYNKIQNNLAYVDLRYSKYLYVGKSSLSTTLQENSL